MANQITIVIGADGNAAITGIRQVGDAIGGLKPKSAAMAAAIKAHWLEVTAALTATAAAVAAAWRLAERAAQFQEHMDLLNMLADEYKTGAAEIVGKIREVSNGLISLEDAARVASAGMAKHLKPDQLVALAEASVTLSDFMGQKVGAAFDSLTQAISVGRSRTLEMTIGVIDLEARYGPLVEKMTEAQRAQAMYTLVMERARELQLATGAGAESTADKMERLTVQIKDLTMQMGSVFLRAFAGAYGAMQWLSAGALALYGHLLKIPQALAWSQSKFGISESIRNEGKRWLQDILADQQAAFDASTALTGEAAKNFEVMLASSSELAKANGHIRRSFDQYGKKSTGRINEEEKALNAFKKSVDLLDPSIDELTKKLIDLKAAYADMMNQAKAKGWDRSEIQKEYIRGQTLINAARIREEQEVTAKLNAIGKEGMTKDLMDLEAWLNQETYAHQNNEQLIVKIMESYYAQRTQISRKWAEQRRMDEQSVFESEMALQRQRTYLAQERGYVTPLQGQLQDKDADIAIQRRRIESARMLVEQNIALNGDLERRKQLETDLLILENQMLGLAEARARIEQQISGTFGEGFSEGIRRAMASAKTAFEDGRELAQSVAGAMTNAFSDFFDSTSQNFLSLRSVAYKVFSDIASQISKMLMTKAFSGLAGALGISGLFEFEKGGIMTNAGPLRLNTYAAGGIADRPQLALFGEGRKPEAYVPLPDGRSIPVTMQGGGGQQGQEVTIVNVLDEALLHKALGSRSGKRIIMNYIREAQG